MYEKSPEQRAQMGYEGKEHIEKNYNFQRTLEKWDNLLSSIYEDHGSWESRKKYKKWEIISF